MYTFDCYIMGLSAYSFQSRHQRPLGHIGIWPEFAMLNHSCVPNVSICVIKDRMLMHAADDIPAGTELCTNCLGPLVAAPLGARRQRLQEGCGFRCGRRWGMGGWVGGSLGGGKG